MILPFNKTGSVAGTSTPAQAPARTDDPPRTSGPNPECTGRGDCQAPVHIPGCYAGPPEAPLVEPPAKLAHFAASDIADWLEWRRGGIGGADIAALIGLSTHSSPTSLAFEKLGLLEDRTEDTPRQRLGKRMESVLADEFHDHTGLYAVGAQTWCNHPRYKWARCTVDGFAAESPTASIGAPLGTVEYKTDARFGWPDGVPANIRAQCVWQMGVTGLQHCWVVVMFGQFRVEVFEIHWDVDAIADWEFMLAAADRFWSELQAGIMPELDDHDATTAALTYVNRELDPDTILEADDPARTLVHSVQHAQLATKAAEAHEVRLKNELRAFLGEKSNLVDGWTTPKRGDPKPITLATWREQVAHRLDLDMLRADHPDLIEKYSYSSTSRVLRVSKPPKED